MAAAARDAVAQAQTDLLAGLATGRSQGGSPDGLIRPGRGELLFTSQQVGRLKATAAGLLGLVDAGLGAVIVQLAGVSLRLEAEQHSAAAAKASHATALKAAEDSARSVLAASRWCVQTVVRAPACGSEVVTLRVDEERVTLRRAFLDASPLFAAFSWHGREADSADPLVLRAPDGAAWWWNAETMVAAEQTLLDIELEWLTPCPDLHSTLDVLPMVKLWKLLFAFFPSDASLSNEPVEQIERTLIDWLRAQKAFNSADVQAEGLSLDSPLGLAIELLHADESRAVREAAARCVAAAAPALLLRKDGSGLRSDACAEECCRALSSEAAATLKTVCGRDNNSAVEGLLFLAKAAISADCVPVKDACLDALVTRYEEVMWHLVGNETEGDDDNSSLLKAVREHMAVLNKLFSHERFASLEISDPVHVLLAEAVIACASELDLSLPKLDEVLCNAIHLAAAHLLQASPYAHRISQTTWRAICDEADTFYSAEFYASIASDETTDLGPAAILYAFASMTGHGGLKEGAALPCAALQEFATRIGCDDLSSGHWLLCERAARFLTVPALVSLLIHTAELHTWPETFDLAFSVLQKHGVADTPVYEVYVENALLNLNLQALTTTTWPLAVRQALDVPDAGEELAHALRGYLRRLQEEEPAEQSAARAAWSEVQARLSSSGTPPDATS